MQEMTCVLVSGRKYCEYCNDVANEWQIAIMLSAA